jgi:hypothetical protein
VTGAARGATGGARRFGRSRGGRTRLAPARRGHARRDHRRHPAIAPDAQVVPALETLCGFSVGELARAFRSSEAAVEKQLTGTKDRIRQAGITFDPPEGENLAPRLEGVLAALYLQFYEGCTSSSGDHLLREELCHEAIRLRPCWWHARRAALHRSRRARPHQGVACSRAGPRRRGGARARHRTAPRPRRARAGLPDSHAGARRIVLSWRRRVTFTRGAAALPGAAVLWPRPIQGISS